jgi:release factor glutamine methyltransferase
MDIQGAEVVATDLSEEALELARSQFGKRDAIPGWTGRLPKRVIPPKFVRADLLDVEATVAAVPGGIDLLTANPPYVMVAEKAEMRRNVLGWEPHMAIFAPEEDPLVFHRAIAEVALRVLVPGGCGIVEINSELPDQTAAVFITAGFSDVRIIPDYFDRPRFVSFRRK